MKEWLTIPSKRDFISELLLTSEFSRLPSTKVVNAPHDDISNPLRD